MEDKKKKKLYRPKNVPEKKYVIKGFTKFAVTLIVIGFLTGLVIGIILYFNYKSIFLLFSPIALLSIIPVFFLVEDEHGESFVFWIKQIIRYNMEQHRYEYKKYNIYERKFYGEKKERE